MKMSYYPETDSLYIELSEKPGADTIVVSDALVIDVDENGTPVGIDIDSNAGEIVDLLKLRLERKSKKGVDAVLALETRFLRETLEAVG